MAHLKPHGALYVMVNAEPELARAVCAAVTAFDPTLAVFALPGSALALAARASGLAVVEEFFADRPYRGSAVRMFGWDPDELGPPQEAAERALHQLTTPTFAGVGTLCVHSDSPAAAARLTALRRQLSLHGWTVAAPRSPAFAPHPA